MKTLSSLGIGFGLVSGCLLLALVAEIYYLFWWKRRRSRDIEDNHFNLTHLLCWKKLPSLNPQHISISDNSACLSGDGLNVSSGKDNLLREFGGGDDLDGLSGPPRFLFTISEETKEDLDSEEGRSRGATSGRDSRDKSCSDLIETPFLTPLSSPPFYTPPLTPFDGYIRNEFNPLFESWNEDSLSRLWSSPPPKFKFLKDAEEKLYKKLLVEESVMTQRKSGAAEDQAKKGTLAHSHLNSPNEED